MMLFKKHKQKKILLVDDDVNAVSTFSMIFARWGFNVVATGDGEEAVKKAKEENPDLIILDVMLPGIDGFEVCKILKSNPETKDIKIILVTGLDKMGEVDKGFRHGADDYIIKPVIWERLKDKISKMLKVKISK